MTAQLYAYGRLGGDPRAIETSTGTRMAVATLAVDVAHSRGGDEQPPLWLGVVAFGHQAEQLLRHAKGDLLSVQGRLQRRVYTDSEGAQREQLQVVANNLISARTVRPGGRREDGRVGAQGRSEAEPFDDPVPF